jgi:RNA recognition motif-containing protein
VVYLNSSFRLVEAPLDHKIRIGNLPQTASKFELEDLLTMVADVRALRLESSDDRGHVETIAYAHVASEQDLQNCVDRFNGASFRGSVISVREDKPFVPRPALAQTVKTKRRKIAGKA